MKKKSKTKTKASKTKAVVARRKKYFSAYLRPKLVAHITEWMHEVSRAADWDEFGPTELVDVLLTMVLDAKVHIDLNAIRDQVSEPSALRAELLSAFRKLEK